MKQELVQSLNPKTHTYVLVDKANAKILKHHPRKNTPYKGVEIVAPKRERIPITIRTKDGKRKQVSFLVRR